MKTHYAHNGEFGSPKTNCGKYWTTDIKHTDDENKVTCKLCKKSLTQ